MHWIEAIILGIIQGLTEFLPVSSSGHLELGKAFFDIDAEKDLTFTVVVHGATVLSTLTVFFNEITALVKNSLSLKSNDSQKYLLKIAVSMIPILILGLFFKDTVESFFGGSIKFVGYMLLITACFLLSTLFIKNERKKNISWLHSFLIGIAQAIAVLPGISRSGITISAGLLLGNNREETAKFSFLMVIIPVIGANLLELKDIDFMQHTTTGTGVYLAGFLAAFISGLFACKWMIKIVKTGNLVYFSIYCFLMGLTAVFLA